MKTKNYNLQKRMISAAIVLIISSVGFATPKADGALSRVTNKSSESIKLNNKSMNPAMLNVTESSAEANINELSLRIEEWLSEGSYWETENSSDLAEKELSDNIEFWMANGSYWALPHHEYKAESALTHKIKNWMNSGSYWETEDN